MSLLTFEQIKKHAKQIVADYGALHDMQLGIRHMYLMDDEVNTPGDVADIKVTRSPDNRNAIVGARRLLSINDPTISIERTTNTDDTDDIADELEEYGQAMFAINNHWSKKPLHSEAALSMLLYDEVQIAINSTAEMLKAAKGLSPARVARMERLAETTPYVYKLISPEIGRPVFDDWGLVAHYSEVEMRVADIEAEWGKKIKQDDKAKMLTVCSYYNLDQRQVWVQQTSDVVMEGELGLPFIPIVCMTGEGSRLFDTPETQREPFLMTELKSGLGARKNLVLTVMYEQIKRKGFAPPWIFETADQGRDRPKTIKDGLDSYRVIQAGDKFTEAYSLIIHPDLIKFWDMATKMGEESTMYKQALGSFTSGTFSNTALLSQMGRLPLEVIKLQTGRALAEVLRISFLWLKHDNQSKGVYSKKSKETLEIDPGIIPDNLDVTVTMDVAMPQDQIGQANLYNQLKQDFPKTWLAENVMKVNNWKELQEDKWNDMATDTAIGLFIQQSVPMMVQQYLQSMMPQPQQPQMPGAGMPENTSQTPAPYSPQENASMPPVEPMPGAAGAGRPMTGEEMGMQEEGMPV